MSKTPRFPALPINLLSVLALFLLASPWQYPSAWWGLNLLQFHDWSVRTIVLIASVLCAATVILGAENLRLSELPRKLLIYLGVPALLTVLFIALRVRAHFLGDGLLRAREIEVGVSWLPTEPLAQLVNFVMYQLTNAPLGFIGTDAVRIVSFIGGIAYYLALLWFVRTAFVGPALRLLMFIVLFFSGTTLLFCGYVETYMLIPALMALFFTAGIKALRGEIPPLVACGFYLLLVLFHFKALIFAPCLLVGAYFANRDGRNGATLLYSAAVVLSVVLAAVVPRLSTLPTLGVSQLIMGLSPSESSYTLLSSQHLIDVINELFLTAGVGLILIVASLAVKPRTSWRKQRPLLLVAAALPGAIAMLLLLHSRLGYAVDWDLFSAAGLTVTFFGAMLFSEYKEFRVCRIAPIALAAVAFALFFSFAAVNASFDKATQRQIQILSLYDLEGAVGFEMMGNHLRNEGDMVLAERMWKRSLALRPHTRIYANLAQLSLNEGRLTDAKYYCDKGLELDSTAAALWTHLGQVYTRLGDYERAVDAQQKAIRYEARDPVYYHNYAITLGLMQRWAEAEQYEREALTRMPNDLKALLGLCVSLINQAKLDEAERICNQMMAINPITPDPYMYLAQIFDRRGQIDRARAVLSGYLQNYPSSPATARISEILAELNRRPGS